MNINRKPILLAAGFVILLGFGLQAQQPVTQGRQMDYESKLDTVRSIAAYFSPVTTKKMTPNAEGFIQRWTLLEPISKPNRSNTVFTDSYLRKTFDTLYFANQFTMLPKNGDKVKVGEQELMWHALDSKLFNVKLFRFAYGLKKPIYGVLFWAVTVVSAPQEMKNVRMAVGSNSASMLWLN